MGSKHICEPFAQTGHFTKMTRWWGDFHRLTTGSRVPGERTIYLSGEGYGYYASIRFCPFCGEKQAGNSAASEV